MAALYFRGDEKLPINEADKLLHRGVKFELLRPYQRYYHSAATPAPCERVT